MKAGSVVNNLKEWMNQKLEQRGIGTSTLSLLTGNQITNATMFRWYNGTFVPTLAKLQLVCETLSQIPVVTGDGQRFEDAKDLLEEAQKQFTRNPYWKS